MFTGYQFYKKLIFTFSGPSRPFKTSLLSISTDENMTYADSIDGLLRTRRNSESQRRLLYLLERGVAYSGTKYISQEEFEREFRRQRNRRLENRSELGVFLSKVDLLRVVFVQAPRNHTINVDILKGRGTQRETLPVFVKKQTYVLITRISYRPSQKS